MSAFPHLLQQLLQMLHEQKALQPFLQPPPRHTAIALTAGTSESIPWASCGMEGERHRFALELFCPDFSHASDLRLHDAACIIANAVANMPSHFADHALLNLAFVEMTTVRALPPRAPQTETKGDAQARCGQLCTLKFDALTLADPPLTGPPAHAPKRR